MLKNTEQIVCSLIAHINSKMLKNVCFNVSETGDSRDISSFSLQEVNNARARDCASKLCTFV